ncbi:MAG: NAD(+) diphosphatase [Candidatus Hodarchaeales archaeon]|jgi:NAD+ diphosphatase
MHFKYEMKPSLEEISPFYYFIFRKNHLLVHLAKDEAVIPFLSDITEIKLKMIQKRYFGLLDNHPCYFGDVSPDTEPPKGMIFLGLRSLYETLEEELLWIAGRAFQLMNWDRKTQFCGRCGVRTEVNSEERAKICPNCSLLNFPRISPAIIVGVINQKTKQILLANGTRFPSSLYSVLAGFVEPGENLEECVKREVKEEVGLEVENIVYFGSQSWPFPDSLMCAFIADYTRGKISVDKAEIKDANWFTKDNLPLIPSKLSISRKIIDWFVANN